MIITSETTTKRQTEPAIMSRRERSKDFGADAAQLFFFFPRKRGKKLIIYGNFMRVGIVNGQINFL